MFLCGFCEIFKNTFSYLKPPVAAFLLLTALKKRRWHRFFPVNFAKFLKTPFLQNTSGRLLPKVILSEVFSETEALEKLMFLAIFKQWYPQKCSKSFNLIFKLVLFIVLFN